MLIRGALKGFGLFRGTEKWSPHFVKATEEGTHWSSELDSWANTKSRPGEPTQDAWGGPGCRRAVILQPSLRFCSYLLKPAGLPWWSSDKHLLWNAGDTCLILLVQEDPTCLGGPSP